jgi:hypothetical protein
MVGTGAEIVESRGGIDVAGDLIFQALQEECAEHDEALFVIDVQNIFVAAAFHRRGGSLKWGGVLNSNAGKRGVKHAHAGLKPGAYITYRRWERLVVRSGSLSGSQRGFGIVSRRKRRDECV